MYNRGRNIEEGRFRMPELEFIKKVSRKQLLRNFPIFNLVRLNCGIRRNALIEMCLLVFFTHEFFTHARLSTLIMGALVILTNAYFLTKMIRFGYQDYEFRYQIGFAEYLHDTISNNQKEPSKEEIVEMSAKAAQEASSSLVQELKADNNQRIPLDILTCIIIMLLILLIIMG